MQAALCAVPTEAIEAVLIDRDSQTIARRHFQAELAVLEWLFEDFLGEKERPEQFGTPFELGKGREELRGRGSSNRTLQHCAAVETDTCRLADRSDLGGGEQAAGAIFRANTSAAADWASWNAVSGPLSASSAMIATQVWRASRAKPLTFLSAIGCSIRSTPASLSSGKHFDAIASLQAWLTSTRMLARSPNAFLIAATWAMLFRGSPRPIFSLKILCRRLASISSASAMSVVVSPLANVQATGNRS